jgi:phenylalanyl-tRNA synthetase beta chain
VVDITNYVMLATAQPMHAFDLDEVRGGRIVVRRAGEGERMTTLDGFERALDAETALVCDAEGPSGIAGVMGGVVSEVSERTTRVLMEAATWVGPNILRTSSRLGLRTEASTRFEKQLHPDQAMAAQRLAARLMVELCGARLAPGTLDAYPRPAAERSVTLRPARLERLLGERVDEVEIEAILGRLGFGVVDGGRGEDGARELAARVPSWRDGDVQRETDLIEEVARVRGLDRLPTTLPARRRAVGRLTRSQRLRRRLEDALRDRGLLEVVAYSFTAPETLAALGLDPYEGLELANPLSVEQSVMRPVLLSGLLDAARHNVARDRPDLALFESAHVYAPSPAAGHGDPPAREPHHLAALLTGKLPASWRGGGRRVDYFAARGLLDGVLAPLGIAIEVAPAEPPKPFLHPGRAAAVRAADRELGWIGELHPRVARAWDLDAAAGFELDCDALAELDPGEPERYRDLTAYPAVLQDIAVVVDEDAPAADVQAAVAAAAGSLLAGVRVFDVYRGEQVGAGRKSLALRLELRAPDRTLTDADAAALRSEIETELERIGGRLRG